VRGPGLSAPIGPDRLAMIMKDGKMHLDPKSRRGAFERRAAEQGSQRSNVGRIGVESAALALEMRNNTKSFPGVQALDDGARSTRSAAKTAPESRRSSRSSAAPTSRTPAGFESTDARSRSRTRSQRERPASASSIRSSASFPIAPSPRMFFSASSRPVMARPEGLGPSGRHPRANPLPPAQVCPRANDFNSLGAKNCPFEGLLRDVVERRGGVGQGERRRGQGGAACGASLAGSDGSWRP